MKRAMTIGFILLSMSAAGYGVEVGFGINFGLRTVADSQIRDVYGNGTVYFPYLRASLWKGLSVGAGYEGGYSRDGKIGLYQEETTLKVSGWEVFVSYDFRVERLTPYVLLGYGSYSYEQTINSEYLAGYKVDSRKSSVVAAAGVRLHAIGGLFLGVEAKYVPLKVKPYEEEVDLSGLRFSAAIGYSFKL
ncbi:MAG: hypothetical protein JSW15_05635 [Deltaproteobacteria bacterium]|nr:MAG: hypothetical protein JSW15_05635 [Deltaproteobacteria bacterium]